jgi:D-alanyl-lipoteichoic acid acyltransferase DltB (MBOAT superfamily)
MLFTSDLFLFVFLPVSFGGHLLLRRWRTPAIWWLVLASICFYAAWDWRFALLLVASIAINYSIGTKIAASGAWQRIWLALGLGFNLGLLGLFKYLGFFAGAIGWTPGFALILPLGISFYSFTQIAWLVDLSRSGDAMPEARDYLLFVTWFPHLIAGPILHHREMIPQFAKPDAFRATLEDIAAGITMLAIGLVKKSILADSLAPIVAPVFDQPAAPALLPAWLAAIAYGLQLYFDFSGYCDMAIGLSRLFGLRLPLNFDSPYQAASIIDFWRRWHMTLSRFLKTYLYIPLGGNRAGLGQGGNILITMALGGLWHGAGWTYLAWGGLHGLYLCVNHAWRRLTTGKTPIPGGQALAQALTLAAVMIAWVPFRAPSLDRAGVILAGMAGGHGFGIFHASSWTGAWLASLLAIVLIAPSSQAIMARAAPALGASVRAAPTWLTWRASPLWASIAGIGAAAAIVRLDGWSPFLYFQF